jgi:hypothetical protein
MENVNFSSYTSVDSDLATCGAPGTGKLMNMRVEASNGKEKLQTM